MESLLPAPVLERQDKTSFYPLFERGVYQREWGAVESLLHRPELVRREYVSEDWLQEELNPDRIRPDLGLALWLCISLELWLRRYW
jgi:hypothetical protein